MSIKSLFGNSFKNYKSASVDVESTVFINNEVEDRQVYLPPIDFNSASNFVKYGLAEMYYKNSIARIYNDYPYDGSKAEVASFYLSSSYLDRWMLDTKYPKTTGFIELGKTANYSTITDGYAITTTPEYLRVWGGIHTSSAGMEGKPLENTFDSAVKFNWDLNQTQNWRVNAVSGTTVEFWMKKPAFNPSNTNREIILDLWNGELSSSGDYGRFTLELTGGSGACFQATVQSGSSGFITASVCSATVTTSSLSQWHHYALSFQSASTGLMTRFYVDGKLNLSGTYGTGVKEIPGLVNGYVGAFQASPSSSLDLFDGINMVGAAKLSASVDEFRFWKTRRTSRQIELNWFNQVGGGANTDPNTTDLGVYFKFNEGITSNPSIDSTVLDYSGRIANGYWQGYDASITPRFTGSAFVLSNLGITESANPIIYSSHPEVTSLVSEMQTSGSNYDNTTGNSLYYSMPQWITEEDDAAGGNLKKVSQILASYFDTLSAQITALSGLRNKGYVEKDYKPLPFAIELLKDKGLIDQNLLINSNILEMFANIDADTVQFEDNIDKIKNLIYINIYNNLEAIYKSKGTEKSIRNLIRCFGIDDEIVKLNIYTDGGTHYFSDKAKGTSVKKKYINFNSSSYFTSTIYQTSSVNNSLTFISGTTDTSSTAGAYLSASAFTLEADVIIPYKHDPDENGYFHTPFLSSSIFGFNEAVESDPTDYTWATSQTSSLSVYLVRDELNSKNAKFVIENPYLDTPINLESDWIEDIYDNQHWNLAIRIKLDTYPYVGADQGQIYAPSGSIDFYAVNTNFGEVENSISLSSRFDNTTGSHYISAPKRVYAGSHYTNYTGSILQKSDLQVGSVRGWLDYISNQAIIEHNKDPLNYGNSKAIREGNIFLVPNKQIPSQDLTIFNWDFDTVTGSFTTGKFSIDDITSGSTNTIYGWVDNIIRREYKGVGASFGSSNSNFIENEFLYAQKKELPEISYTNDNIYIKGDREKFFSRDEDVSDNFYLIEKSLNQIVSEEMIKMFSTVQEFANLVGRPKNLYRMKYDSLDKVRQHFFEKIEEEIDFERFMRYYKWIDESISKMIAQLIPATVNFGPEIMDVVESHILERNKYQRRIGLLTTMESTEGSAMGIGEQTYNWRISHAPIPENDNVNCLWQRERKERTNIPDRETLRKSIIDNVKTKGPTLTETDGTIYEGSTYAIRHLTKPYKFSVNFSDSIHGGINYNKQKNRDFVRSAVSVHGQKGASGAPRNILGIGIGLGDGIIEKQVCLDVTDPNKKEKYNATVAVAKFSNASALLPLESYMSYIYRIKSNLILPSNIMSGTVKSGYNKMIADGFRETAIVTNLHSDTIDITNEIPMQGPFTEAHVGGSQNRHINLNRYNANLATKNNLDDQYSRPEAWRLLIGDNPSSPSPDGAMGYVGPDYGGPYPDSDRKWAIYYRPEKAKRSVNIKNIHTTTASAIQGNYNNNYEIVSTVGQLEQRYYLRRLHSSLGLVAGLPYTDLPQTTQLFGLFSQIPSTSHARYTIEFNKHFWTTAPPYNNASWANTNTTITITDVYGKTIVFRVKYQGGGIVGSEFEAGGSANICADNFITIVKDATHGFNGTVDAIRNGSQVTIVQNVAGIEGNTSIVIQANFPVLTGAGTTVKFSGGAGMLGIGVSPTFGPNSLYAQSQITDEPSPYPRTDLTSSRSIITSRFSAPGGPEINTRGFLDIVSGEYSAYNNLNYRNLTVRSSGSGEPNRIRAANADNRRDGLRSLLSQHCGKGGLIPGQEISSEDTGSANPIASYYKLARNTRSMPRISSYKIANAIRGITSTASKSGLFSSTAQGYPTSGPITISFWVNYGNLVDFPCNIFTGPCIIQQNADDTLAFKADDSGAETREWRSSKTIPVTVEWTHILIEWSGVWDENVKFYFNGELDPASYEAGTTAGFVGGNRRKVGQLSLFDSFFSSGGEFHGGLFQFITFNSILNSAEKTAVRNTNNPLTFGLGKVIDYWQLGEEFTISNLTPGTVIPNSSSIISAIGNNDLMEDGDLKIVESPGLKTLTKDVNLYNNMNYSSLLPASDFQYAWVMQAVSGSSGWMDKQRLRGYAPKSGEMVINNFNTGEIGKIVPAIDFPTISDISCCSTSENSITVTIPASGERGEPTTHSTTTGLIQSSITVLPTDSANAGGPPYQIWVDDMSQLSWSAAFDNCCDTGNQYAMTIYKDGDSVPTPSYQDTQPSLATGNYDGDINGYIVFWIKDCNGNEKSFTIVTFDGYWS